MTDLSSEQAYQQEFDAFMKIPKEDLVYCNKPLEVGTAEANQLAIVAAEDRQQLIDVGIDPVYVDTLKSRAAAFSYAAAKYELVANADPEIRKQWETLSPAGYELQRYLMRFYSFAFRKDSDLTQSVKKIQEGRGDKDMILDLLSAHILGSENKELLTKIKTFDLSKIDEAKTLHEKLTALYARTNIDPKQINKAKDILYHAYTHYKQAADQVKEHGQFAFEETDRYNSYISAYRSNLSKARASKKTSPEQKII